MLEPEIIWTGWDEEIYREAYKEGVQIGKIEWKISWVKSLLRKEERYRKMSEKKNELSHDVKKEIERLLVLLDEEKTKDIISFLTKYPALSEVQLAKRILRESEYWH